MKQLDFLKKEFFKINELSLIVYRGIQGGNIRMNLLSPFKEYEDNGVFGWIKERNSFVLGIEAYDLMAGNEAWDVIDELEEEMDHKLRDVSMEEIDNWGKIDE